MQWKLKQVLAELMPLLRASLLEVSRIVIVAKISQIGIR
jgi:hypothetical protein